MAATGRRVGLQCVFFCLILNNSPVKSNNLGPQKRANTYLSSNHSQRSLFYGYNSKKSERGILTARMQQQQQRHPKHQDGQLSDVYQQKEREYVDFYARDAPSFIPSREIVDDFHSTVKKYNEQQQRIEMPNHLEDIPIDVSVMDRLWHALRDGTLPPQETAILKQKAPRVWNHAATMKSLIVAGSIVEVGTGATILHLAKVFNNVTCVGIITSGELVSAVTQVAQTEGISNLYVTNTSPEQLTAAAESLYYNPQILFGNLLVTNLTSLVSNSLPHELEELLGRLLALSARSIVIGLHPDDTNRAYFEQSWVSVRDLVQQACRVGRLDCSLQDAAWPAGVEASGWMHHQVVEVRIKHGVRPIEDATCQLRKPNTQCELHFGEDLEESAMLYSDNTREDIALTADAVPFYVLLSLGVTDYTRSQMFLGALNLPFNAQSCTKRLAVDGGIVRDNFPRWSEDELCDDDNQQMAELSNTENTKTEDNVGEAMLGEDMGPNIAETQSSRNRSVVKVPPIDPPEGAPKGMLADSQVDGVAQGWNRVEVKLSAGGGGVRRQEEQQYQAMAKHWDRENIEDGAPRHDPLQEQDRKELARLARAWDRELPAEPQGTVKAGWRKQAEAAVHRVTAAGQRVKGEDAVLRRDEKELRRAMGFLHGDTDVKGIKLLLSQRHHRRQSVLQDGNPAQSTVTATPRPRSTSTTFSSSRFLSKPGRKSSTHPQKSPSKGKAAQQDDTSLRFQPLAKPELLDKVEDKLARDNIVKDPVVANEELERILRDDSTEQTEKNRKKNGAAKHKEAANEEVPREEEEADENDGPDGFDLGQDYVGLDKSKNIDDKEAGKLDDDGAKNWNPLLGPVIDNNQWGQMFQARRDGLIDGDGDRDRETNDALKELAGGGEKLGDGDTKLKVVEDPEGQQEDGDIPGAQELGDEHMYEEVKMNYDVVPDKNKRRLLAQDIDASLQSDVRDLLSSIPRKFRQKMKNAITAKATTKGKFSGFLADRNKNFETARGELTPDVGQKGGVDTSRVPKPATKESLPTQLGEEINSPGGVHAEVRKQQEEGKQTVKLQSLRFGVRSFGPSDREEELYDDQWRNIHPRIKADVGESGQTFNVLTYGSRSQSLVGLKIARAYPAAHILSLMPTRGTQAAERQRKVMESVGADNVILLTADMTPSLVNTLSLSPDLARYQILGMELYEWLLQLQLGFPYYLGRLLSLATTSFLEVPEPAQLKLLLGYFKLSVDKSEGSAHRGFKGVVREALRLVNAENSTLTLLSDHHLHSHSHIKMLQVQIHSLRRPVQVNCGSPYLALLNFEIPSAEIHLERAQQAFSLHLLLEAGLREQPTERARVFSWYLQQTLHKNMCPLHIIWHSNTLVYSPPFSTTPLNRSISHSPVHRAQASLKTLQREISQSPPFSFMEYGAQNSEISLSLAQTYRNSTILSLVDNNAKIASAMYQRVTAAGVKNLIVLNTTLSEALTTKLLYSPEFLRYQHIGLGMILQLMRQAGSRQQFDLMLGQILATGATTFLQLPSDQMFSLAMTTFFPWSYSGKPRSDKYDPQMYLVSQHPLPVYINSEKQLLGQSAKADVDIEISVHIIPSTKGATGEQPPWSLARIDVKNLTVEVNHHFDYRLDGHHRKYILHCETPTGVEPHVWLRRSEDDFHIPYGNVHVISLIALLRMGLLEEDKTRFYDKFLSLPYYEDMAPWNIVFDAGNLTYIDYDSRNITLNKLAPAAFQVISMLLNYERTVKDFGKCKQRAKINYGINVVGLCVGSPFIGPCMDNRLPVPCGDGTCRATYMECLQVLQTLEQEKQNRLLTVTQNLRKGQTATLQKESPFDKDIWRFGANGVITDGPNRRVNS